MSAIDWLPKRNGCVGVAAVKNVNFDERVQLSGQASMLQQVGRMYDGRPTNAAVRLLITQPQVHHILQAHPAKIITLCVPKQLTRTQSSAAPHRSNETHRTNTTHLFSGGQRVRPAVGLR